jgi:DHA1 family bicyclomycin/chloramphenicol resistance-like MFS transporter
MALFHGTLSDSFGRRPVVLAGLGLFIVASIGCSMARDAWDLTAWRAIQGMASGVGTAVGRAMTRDLFEERHARRVMSQITMLFGIAPVIAPIIGAWLFVYLGWIAIFWFLALLGLLLFALSWRKLPESLPPGGRQPFRVGPLMAGYKTLATDERLALFCLAGGMPFSALFLYIFSTPSFLGMHLGLLPTQYFWFFVSIVSGTMLGAHLGGRLSGRISAMRQVSIGYAAMIVVVVLNALYHGLFAPQSVPAIILLGAYAIGLSLMAPGVAVLALDLHPTRRGMTSSLQMFIGQFINAIMASLIVPYVLDSTAHMAWMMAGFIAIGFMAWMALGWRHGLTHHAKAGG